MKLSEKIMSDFSIMDDPHDDNMYINHNGVFLNIKRDREYKIAERDVAVEITNSKMSVTLFKSSKHINVRIY